MKKVLLILVGIILVCWPNAIGAPAAVAESATQPTTPTAVSFAMPLNGPSLHANYIGDATTVTCADLNSDQTYVFGIDGDKFLYQPNDTWFIYGLFGPIEAIQYDWNVKYEGWNGQHNGIDLATAEGGEVVSSTSGRVVFTGWKAGQTVVVESENYRITYAHLSQIFVQVGESVAQSQPIGLTGSTGTPNPHLHFQIDKLTNGTWQGSNPKKYLLSELETAIMPDVPANRY